MLGYLLDPFIQIQNDNGTPIVGAKIYVYNADTTNLSTTYNDFEGHLNTNPVITDDFGNATIIADDGIEYDVSVHDENDLLLFTKKYISIDKTSSAGGNTQVVAGYGVTVVRVGNVFTVSVDTDLIATKDDLADKQDKLTGGANIEITDSNVINVVNRKELVTQYPLRTNRTNNRIKIYLDSDFSDEFKTKQTPVEYGGSSGQYISYITQNTNGDIEATVSETVFPSFDNIHAGDNIDITRNGNDLTISGKDWTNDIQTAPTTYSWDVTPYSAGSNINITNHVISGKDWTNEINSATIGKLDTSATTNWDITPYSAGSNINITNHVVSGKDWTSTINSATSGKLDTTATAGWDVTPYTAGNDSITVSNHKISLANNYITQYRAPKSISCTKDGTRYTIYSVSPGTGIADAYTFTTLYNTTTQKFELEVSNDNHRVFSAYVDGVFVDTLAATKKIYETDTTGEGKPIKVELVGAGAGNDAPLYRFTVIFSYLTGTNYKVSLYIEYDYNHIINV